MSNAVLKMDETTYLQGIPLSEAIFKLAPPEKMAAWRGAFKSFDPQKAASTSGEGFLGALQVLGQGLTAIQDASNCRKDIQVDLQKSLLGLLKSGNIFAWGFKMPRNIEDQAIKIPVDLFFNGIINWKNSALNSQGIEFSGIRIFENSGILIEATPNNSKNSQKLILSISENSENEQKQDFHNLSPEKYIDEKAAADFIGISPRTLQGYRLKGGGPKFLKLKKAVRYKIHDLIEWSENNKKSNTSE